MKKALLGLGMILTVAACVFGGVLAGAAAAGGVPPGSFLAKIPGASRLVGTRSTDRKNPEEAQETAESGGQSGEAERMPYLEMAPSDALEDMVQDLEERVSDVNNREERLARREKELEAWEETLKDLRQKVTELAKKKKKKLVRLKERIERKREKLKQQKIAMSRRREDNLKKAAKVYNRMDAARAAGTLARMYEDGKKDTVVQIIYLMKDRSAAEVLGAMPDNDITAEITRRLAHVSTEAE